MSFLPLAAALAIGTGGLTACSDSTEPPDPDVRRDSIVVTASMENASAPLIVEATASRAARLQCSALVRLSASGTGRSRFSEMTVYRIAGRSRATPTDTLRLTGAQMQSAFGAAEIVAGAGLLGAWVVEDSVPFTTRFVIRHRPDGSATDETLTGDVPCGPLPSPEAPTLANVAATPPAGDFEPGDTIVVRFDVTAPSGLWRTAARLSGPCELTAAATERLETTSQRRELRFAIPRTCELGVPFRLWVEASDGALRADTADVPTGLALVDRVAPSLLAAQNATGWLQPVLFAGDSLNLRLFANDNVRLRWFTIAPGTSSTLDSVPVHPDAFGIVEARFAVRNAWVGAPYLRVQAIDGGGNRSAEVNTESNLYRFYPSTSRAATAVTLQGDVSELVVDRQGRSHVMQTNASRLVMLARGTLAAVATTSVPEARPSALVATPGGDSLVMLQFGRTTFRIVDVRGSTPVLGSPVAIQGLDAAKGEAPGAFVVTARGTALMIVQATAPADWRVVELDLATGATTRRDIGASGAALLNTTLARSGDGRTVVASTTTYTQASWSVCARRWTLDTDAFTACTTLSDQVGAPLLLDRTGATVVTRLRILDGSFGGARPIALNNASNSYPLAIAPDGATVYAAYGNGLVRIRASDGATLELLRGTATLAGYIGELVRLSPDGTVAVIASGNSDANRVFTMELP